MQPTVLVRHPELDPDGKLDPARVSTRAFEKLYEPKGWRVVGDDGEYLKGKALKEALVPPVEDAPLEPLPGESPANPYPVANPEAISNSPEA